MSDIGLQSSDGISEPMNLEDIQQATLDSLSSDDESHSQLPVFSFGASSICNQNSKVEDTLLSVSRLDNFPPIPLVPPINFDLESAFKTSIDVDAETKRLDCELKAPYREFEKTFEKIKLNKNREVELHNDIKRVKGEIAVLKNSNAELSQKNYQREKELKYLRNDIQKKNKNLKEKYEKWDAAVEKANVIIENFKPKIHEHEELLSNVDLQFGIIENERNNETNDDEILLGACVKCLDPENPNETRVVELKTKYDAEKNAIAFVDILLLEPKITICDEEKLFRWFREHNSTLESVIRICYQLWKRELEVKFNDPDNSRIMDVSRDLFDD